MAHKSLININYIDVLKSLDSRRDVTASIIEEWIDAQSIESSIKVFNFRTSSKSCVSIELTRPLVSEIK